ncbi:hypothetical protein K2Z83_24520 [Oscillochloris sp. ZM17-4]|uniref:DUF6508 domain-containing protein n=1 Tax=Oscillochloris sp. ZM17-4 TaxID=2866714 RepID=UPI001C739B4E|nr:DUF6508 domain-containing protein [Oscillochloris sp. ZM17-4]MBX0330827.1 hypothetical protein [Oscillochloris sp. ZM17-4]
MISSPNEISLSQLDALLAFLPIFERPGYSFGEWQTQPGVFPYWSASPETSAFIHALHREGFITPFDWGAWPEEARRYTEGGATALATADLTTLRKLMTSYVRADRFTTGTLASLFQSGQITAVLRRLRQIRDAMGAQDQEGQ